MSVKRYDGTRYVEMREYPQGDYILHSDYAALEACHNALVEAVAWERECDECGEWLHGAWWDRNELDLEEIEDLYDCARAEVDRLIAEPKTQVSTDNTRPGDNGYGVVTEHDLD